MITITEAAKIIGVTRQMVHKLVVSGKIPAKRFGRNWVLTQRSIEKYLKNRGN